MLAAFVLAFAAGVAAGFLAGRPRPKQGSWLSAELALTPAQEEQMRKIWSEVMSGGRREQFERRAALDKERDEAIRNLLPEESLAAYEALLQEHAQKVAGLSDERRKQFQAAVDRTKAMLTEAQRAKYEEFLKKRGDRPPMFHHGREGPGRPNGFGAPERKEQPRPPMPGPH